MELRTKHNKYIFTTIQYRRPFVLPVAWIELSSARRRRTGVCWRDRNNFQTEQPSVEWFQTARYTFAHVDAEVVTRITSSEAAEETRR